MSCAEYSSWEEDNLFFVGVNNKLINEKKYVVSLQMMPMSDNEIKFDSRGFDSLHDVIVATSGRTNVAQFIKKELRCLYFDFDRRLGVKLKLDPNEFTDYVERFIGCLNKVLNKNQMSTKSITYDDLQIHTKTLDNHIKSIHIIIQKYHTHHKQMNNLAKLINAESTDIEVDMKIYDSTRRLFNCHSGKIGFELFEYHPSNTKPYSLIWIDDIDSHHDSAHIDFTLQPKQEVIAIEEDQLSYLITHKRKYLGYSRNWLKTMLYVKYSGEMTREDFCKETLFGDWDYYKNLKEWDDGDTKYAIKTIDDLTADLFTTRFIRNPVNKKFFAHINAPKELQNALRDVPPETMIINIDGLYFDKKTGILTLDGKTSLYHADMNRKPIHSNTIDVSQDDIYDKIKNDPAVFVNALYGGGKTHFVIAPIIMDAIKNDLSVLVITENNSLNKQYEADDRLQLVSHLKNLDADYQVSSMESLWKLKHKRYDVVVLDEMLSIMTHFHSNKTMKTQEIVIYEKMMYYISICKKCVVCDADLTEHTYASFLDSISKRRVIHKIIVPKYVNYTYNIVFKRGIIISKIVDDLKNELKIICACDRKQTAKEVTKTIMDIFPDKNVLCVLGNETASGYLLNDEELTTEQHRFLFGDNKYDADYDPSKKYDLCEFIELYKIDAMVYSPKIKTGVSINGSPFHKQYGIGSGRSVTSREFIQILHRARDLDDTNIWISLP